MGLNGISIFTQKFTNDKAIIAKSKKSLEVMTTKIKAEYEKQGLPMSV